MRAVQGPGLQIQCLAQDWRDTEHTFQMVQGQLHQLESCLETGLKASRVALSLPSRGACGHRVCVRRCTAASVRTGSVSRASWKTCRCDVCMAGTPEEGGEWQQYGRADASLGGLLEGYFCFGSGRGVARTFTSTCASGTSPTPTRLGMDAPRLKAMPC